VFSKILFFSWLLAIAFFSLVDYSSISRIGLSKGLGTGFYLHILFYFIAAVLSFFAMNKQQNKKMILILLMLFVAGVIFEIVQAYIPNRTYNPWDIVGNGLGLVFFYVFQEFWIPVSQRIKYHRSSVRGVRTRYK
jgi:surface polysaccharide O-acyltransferase-like enzyme